MPSEPKAWEQQPGETRRTFGWFCIYRDLGPERSLDRVHQEVVKRSSGKAGVRVPTLSAIKSVSRPPYRVTDPATGKTRIRGQDWLRRAQAWEAEMDRLRRGKRIAAFLKEDEDEGVGLNAIFARLLERVSRGPLPEDPINLNDAIARFLETVRVRRLRRGQVTELSGDVPMEPVASEEEVDAVERVMAANPDLRDRIEDAFFRLIEREGQGRTARESGSGSPAPEREGADPGSRPPDDPEVRA